MHRRTSGGCNWPLSKTMRCDHLITPLEAEMRRVCATGVHWAAHSARPKSRVAADRCRMISLVRPLLLDKSFLTCQMSIRDTFESPQKSPLRPLSFERGWRYPDTSLTKEALATVVTRAVENLNNQ